MKIDAPINLCIKTAGIADLPLLMKHDVHVSEEILHEIILAGRVYLARVDDVFAGWMRHGLFWDETPFLNMLYLLAPFRNRGFGRQMMAWWEGEMLKRGFCTVMTSTQVTEHAQHFYQKLGYRAVGGFFYNDDPYEIILIKNLD